MQDVKTNQTKEAIFKAFMNIKVIEDLFDYPKTKTSNGLKFVLKEQGRDEFNYDTDSGKTSSHVYEVNGVFVRLNGVYYSCNGLTLHSWEFVQPKTIQKVEYVKD